MVGVSGDAPDFGGSTANFSDGIWAASFGLMSVCAF